MLKLTGGVESGNQSCFHTMSRRIDVARIAAVVMAERANAAVAVKGMSRIADEATTVRRITPKGRTAFRL
jgi:hypothetical protein